MQRTNCNSVVLLELNFNFLQAITLKISPEFIPRGAPERIFRRTKIPTE